MAALLAAVLGAALVLAPDDGLAALLDGAEAELDDEGADAVALWLPALEPLVAVLLEPEELALGGNTDTPPEEPPLWVLPLEALPEPLEPAPLALALVEPDGAAVLDEDGELELDVDGELVDDDVDGCDVCGAVLCVVEVCPGGVLVRVLCPTGKNEPPVMSVAMIPAITATRAIPISRSGQLRRSQSMGPFYVSRYACRPRSEVRHRYLVMAWQACW